MIKDLNKLLERERVKGIEPSYAAWEAAVLPLNYTRSCEFELLCINYKRLLLGHSRLCDSG